MGERIMEGQGKNFYHPEENYLVTSFTTEEHALTERDLENSSRFKNKVGAVANVSGNRAATPAKKGFKMRFNKIVSGFGLIFSFKKHGKPTAATNFQQDVRPKLIGAEDTPALTEPSLPAITPIPTNTRVNVDDAVSPQKKTSRFGSLRKFFNSKKGTRRPRTRGGERVRMQPAAESINISDIGQMNANDEPNVALPSTALGDSDELRVLWQNQSVALNNNYLSVMQNGSFVDPAQRVESRGSFEEGLIVDVSQQRSKKDMKTNLQTFLRQEEPTSNSDVQKQPLSSNSSALTTEEKAAGKRVESWQVDQDGPKPKAPPKSPRKQTPQRNIQSSTPGSNGAAEDRTRTIVQQLPGFVSTKNNSRPHVETNPVSISILTPSGTLPRKQENKKNNTSAAVSSLPVPMSPSKVLPMTPSNIPMNLGTPKKTLQTSGNNVTPTLNAEEQDLLASPKRRLSQNQRPQDILSSFSKRNKNSDREGELNSMPPLQQPSVRGPTMSSGRTKKRVKHKVTKKSKRVKGGKSGRTQNNVGDLDGSGGLEFLKSTNYAKEAI